MTKKIHSYNEWLDETTLHFNKEVKAKSQEIIEEIIKICQSDSFDSFIKASGRELLDSPMKDGANKHEFAFIMNDATYITAFNLIKGSLEALEHDYEQQTKEEMDALGEGK